MKASTTADRRPKSKFRLVEFRNRTGSISFRVTGTRRNGERIRENYADAQEARCRQIELEAEFLNRESEAALRTTKLTEEQIRIAESVFRLVPADDDIVTAVSYWLTHGRQKVAVESPRLDEAVEQYLAAQEASTTIRPLTKQVNRSRCLAFVNATPNVRVADVTPDLVYKFLDGIHASQRTKFNYKCGVSAFMSWCMDRPRRWISVNPCHAVKVKMEEDLKPPVILSVPECQAMMRSAEGFQGGCLVPYFAMSLFLGLRPFECRRVDWSQFNFEDREVRIEACHSKVKRSRVVKFDEAAEAWLRAYRHLPIRPEANFVNLLRKFTESIGYGTPTTENPELKPWTKDVLRHTAISHYFRKTHSYGDTAERHGNSERIIKRHYQGRVTTEDTRAFYAIRPERTAP